MFYGFTKIRRVLFCIYGPWITNSPSPLLVILKEFQKREERISFKYMDVICTLGRYFDAIIYAIGAFILSVVILF